MTGADGGGMTGEGDRETTGDGRSTSGPSRTVLELDGLTHEYGSERAVDDVSLSVEGGELVVVVGPSGCGKTTIVQSIAGHVRPTSGRVRLRGADVTDSPPENRGVGIVFQQPTLYPHMTVAENVAYGLKARNVDRGRQEAIVADHLDLVGLGDRHDALPGELSGGQKRRVELARALAPEPDVLVLDEPLSALDRALRERLREEISRIQRETGVTTLAVTHDQEAAMALADRLVVMHDGRVAGVGTPRRLYESPPTPFVGSFLGRSNTFSATVTEAHREDDGPAIEDDVPAIEVDGRRLALAAGETTSARGESGGDVVTCHVRPKDLSIDVPVDGGDVGTGYEEADRSLVGDVVSVADVGRRYDVTVRVGSGERHEELVVEPGTAPPSVGDVVSVTVPRDALTVFNDDG